MSDLEERLSNVRASTEFQQPPMETSPTEEMETFVKELPEQTQEKLRKGVAQANIDAGNFNIGIANILGAPVDLVDYLGKSAGIVSPNTYPYVGSKHIKEMFEKIDGIPPEEQRTGYRARAFRILGETAIPYGAAYGRGAQLSMKATEGLTDLQKALVLAYQKPWVSAGAETTAAFSAAAGGEIASQIYPDNFVAEALGELAGGLSLSLLRGIATNLPSSRALQSIFSGEGAQLRASKRTQELAGDIDQARVSLLRGSELGLDPITASGDKGLLALEKAALDADPKLAERIAILTNKAMETARKQIITGGDPAATTDYLQALRRTAAARAQKEILELGTDADTIKVARIIRNNVEVALRQARVTEKDIWSKLPKQGIVDPSNISGTWESTLLDRTIAANPDDIPSFVSEWFGKLNNKGVFVPGKAAKTPTLGIMKDLRSRLQTELAAERAKDAPNWNKLRILGDLQDSIFDTLSKHSPDYEEAVGYSRSLNEKFTRGKVGRLLGYERTGEISTTPEGTIEYLLSGNKDDIRQGIRQLEVASPDSIPQLKEGIKSMFNIQAIDRNSGALNVSRARLFLKNNSHILDEFPELKSGIERSIKAQRVVDEMVGAPIGDKLSTYIKDKSVMALYLEGTPDLAMHRLVSAKNREGAGALMRQMKQMTDMDKTGQATNGLKAAFGRYMLKHSETGDVGTISGKKFINFLTELGPAAKELYSKEELSRLFRIGTELRKIETREAARAAKGGVISDVPSKIIRIIGGTFAARAGAKVGAGSSGASLRTASIFTKEYNEILGRLTNDGAEQILLKSVEDPAVLNMLLKEASPQNIKEANKMFRSFLTGQALTSVPGESERSTEMSLEMRLDNLRKGMTIPPEATNEQSE